MKTVHLFSVLLFSALSGCSDTTTDTDIDTDADTDPDVLNPGTWTIDTRSFVQDPCDAKDYVD